MTNLEKTPTTPTVVDPRSGEVLDLAEVDHRELVAIFSTALDYERQVQSWRRAAEDELVRRHGDRRAAQVVGDVEVDVDRKWTREWDTEELLGVLQYLEENGLLTRAEGAGIVRREVAYKVDGRKAAALLEHLDGEALVELRSCFQWKQKGRATVTVTPVVALE